MSGPDTSKPVPAPPHFSATCDTCNRRLDTARDTVFPGDKPWTYRCERHKVSR